MSPKTTVIHVFEVGYGPDEAVGRAAEYVPWEAPISMTVNEFIMALPGIFEAGHKITVTQFWPQDNGKVYRGHSFVAGSQDAQDRLEAVGWNENKGKWGKEPPVYLAVRKEKA